MAVLSRFNEVVIDDSTAAALPDELVEQWKEAAMALARACCQIELRFKLCKEHAAIDIQPAVAYRCRMNTRRREANACQIPLVPSLGVPD